jgi:hypothetical protein
MTLVAALIQGGTVTAVLGFMLALVRIAIGSERRRADDWRTAAQTTAAANDILTGHVEALVSSVGQLTTSQREMMSLLQGMAHDGRSAA